MAYAVSTLADLKISMADRLTNATVPTTSATLTFWTRLLNRGVLYCADRLRLSTPTSLTTASGTIALPLDFITVVSVFDSGDIEQGQVDQDNLTTHTGPVFWITGDQLNGFYLNTPTDATWTVKYSYRPAPMVDATDKCLIPDPEAVVAYACSLVRKSQSDPFEDAESLMAECDSRLTEMKSQNSTNNSLNFSWE